MQDQQPKQVVSSSSIGEDGSGSGMLEDSIFTSMTHQRLAEHHLEKSRKGDRVCYYATLHTVVAVVLAVTAGTLAYFTYTFTRDQEVNQFEAMVGACNFAGEEKR